MTPCSKCIRDGDVCIYAERTSTRSRNRSSNETSSNEGDHGSVRGNSKLRYSPYTTSRSNKNSRDSSFTEPIAPPTHEVEPGLEPNNGASRAGLALCKSEEFLTLTELRNMDPITFKTRFIQMYEASLSG